MVRRSRVLQLDPSVPGVFQGPYPLGIDPVSAPPRPPLLRTAAGTVASQTSHRLARGLCFVFTLFFVYGFQSVALRQVQVCT